MTSIDYLDSVDPHKPSGQNLFRLYASKKTKIILNAVWVHECIKANQLQTFHVNWAGCKVTGNERWAHFSIIILSLLNSYVTVSISRVAQQGALRNPKLGQSNPFILRLCKLRYPRLNPCNHTNFRCTLLCRGQLLVRLPGQSR
jgi:hypothetical protein